MHNDVLVCVHTCESLLGVSCRGVWEVGKAGSYHAFCVFVPPASSNIPSMFTLPVCADGYQYYRITLPHLCPGFTAVG